MYPPPQSAFLESTNNLPDQQDHHKHFNAHIKLTSQSHPAPFAYEYRFEEGKMPFLAKLHPMKTREMKQDQLDQEIALFSSQPTQQQRKIKRQDRELHFDMHTTMNAIHSLERTTDKLKRAFSLSGTKTSSRHGSGFGVTVPPTRNDSTRSAPPAISVPLPNLVLPTPSSSPELPQDPDSLRNSTYSYPSTEKSMNFSHPRSSWASSTDAQDQWDLQFLRETAQGRFSSNASPVPVYNMRSNKALQILGITEMPMTPPYTPTTSAAPSVYGPHSRLNSRRPSIEQPRLNSGRASMEQRLSQLSSSNDEPSFPSYRPLLEVPAPVTPPANKVSSLEGDQTPRALQVTDGPMSTAVLQKGGKFPKVKKVVVMSPKIESPDETTPRPNLKRKTSKFTEHIDTTPEITKDPYATSSIAPPRPPLFLFPDIKKTTPAPSLTVPLRKPVPPSSLGRGQSMRTPSPRLNAWGTIVRMADAQHIVAMGQARLITS